MNLSKINTYVSFAIKSGTCLFGTDNILKSKNVKLIIVSNLLSVNSLNKIKNKFSDEIIYKNDELFEGFLDKNIKALAITNKDLADACRKELY